MRIKDHFLGYGIITKIFHHVRIILLLLIYIFQISRAFYPSNSHTSSLLLSYHIKAAMLLFFVVLLSIVWSLFNPKPMSYALSRSEHIVNKITIFLLYTFLIFTILFGMATFSLHLLESQLSSPKDYYYAGIHIHKMTLLPGWVLLSYGDILNHTFYSFSLMVLRNVMALYHQLFALFLLPALLLFHILSIFYGQFLRKNNIIKRML